jgi:hypothetical protein
MSQFQPRPSRPRNAGLPSAAIPPDRTIAPFTRWAIYAWMFSLPYDVITPSWLPEVFQGVLSLPRMAGILLMLCFVIDPKTRPWKLPPTGLTFAVYFVVFTASMMRSDFSNYMLIFQQFQLFVLFLISYNLFLSRQALRGSLCVYSIACGFASILLVTGLAEGELTEWETRGREYAFGANPNLYGKLLVVGWLVTIGLAHIRKEEHVFSLPILWGIALLILVPLGMTGSRGATLSLGVGLATFLLRKGSLLARLRNIILLIVVGGLVTLMFGRSEVLLERWTETWERGTSSGRDIIFPEAFQMVMEKPLIGWGISATRELAIRTHSGGEVRATHNMALAILTFAGLAGFIPFITGYLRIAWACWRSRRGVENVLPLALFVAILSTDMISGGLPEKLHWTFFAYMLAAEKEIIPFPSFFGLDRRKR